MAYHKKTNEKTVNEPKLQCLLGEIPIDPNQKSPLGGINPYSPHFAKIGNQFLQFFIDHANIHKESKVLDIGCGTGRIAKAFEGFLEEGKYAGFDVNDRFVDYCRKTYDKSFQFDHLDIQHDEYNPNGTINPNNIRLPYNNQSFDFVCAIAVFNHLEFDWVSKYISEISRLLVPNGIFFATMILLNHLSIGSIKEKQTHPFKFDLRENNSWFDYVTRPLWNVAIKEIPIRRQFVSNKLMIKEPIRYGEWCGSSTAITGHDVVIAIKG